MIEGRFLPNERRPEGPFGEFMGYYMPVGNNAVFEVLGVTCRKDAVFHSILCGSPEEVLTLELSVSAKIFERVSSVLPGIVDVTCQPFVLHSVVKIRQQYEGHARQVLLAVIGAEPTWAKMVTVVDEDVDIYNMDDVMWAILTRSRPDKDLHHRSPTRRRSTATRTRTTGAGWASTPPRRSPGATNSNANAFPAPTRSICPRTLPRPIERMSVLRTGRQRFQMPLQYACAMLDYHFLTLATKEQQQ